MKKSITTLIGMGIGAALLTSNVMAAPADNAIGDLVANPIFKWYYDYKTFNGSTCQPHFGNQAGAFKTGTFGILNQSKFNRWVSCPIMRDDTETTRGATFNVYLNRAKGGRCGVYSLDPHGKVIKSQWKNVSSNGKTTLSFSLNKSVKMGNYFMYCLLPKGGFVNSYKLKELYTDLNRRTDKDASGPVIIPLPPVIKNP